ncbi:MAG: ABC transporter permease [Candidatus Faecousia sp.]|nr:ABC transporter permease [Clostridiales bacterium]MDD5882479.1 ABC transporter permease [Bacillota bacterium]MDY4598421.1 ABC transporter permease [Candidatus Faecousia sp.]
MSFLIQQTLLYAVPLMVVALAGVFAERSGIINLALEGIMIFGAFIGVLFVRSMQSFDVFTEAARSGDWLTLQGLELLAMLVSALMGAVFSLLLSFASINLKADQTVGGTALNMMAPALVLFLVRILANQNTLQMATGDAASWFMIKKSTFGIKKNVDIGFLGETFIHKVYLATYICILVFIILSIILYKTRFGLRLRSCGENPQAADSLGINVYKMRYAGTTISGALAGMGGFVYSLTTANCTANGDVAGFGFLALAVMIFGNWKPLNIAGASLLFGLFKCIAAAYSSIDLNGDGIYTLANLGISSHLYRMLPYLVTLAVLAFTSKKSRAPKAEGIPYDKGSR